jgi:hypothetical protein
MVARDDIYALFRRSRNGTTLCLSFQQSKRTNGQDQAASTKKLREGHTLRTLSIVCARAMMKLRPWEWHDVIRSFNVGGHKTRKNLEWL